MCDGAAGRKTRAWSCIAAAERQAVAQGKGKASRRVALEWAPAGSSDPPNTGKPAAAPRPQSGAASTKTESA